MRNADASASTRTALLDAAIELLARHEVANTSVREIVGRAGLTKGAFYHHFDSKAHLVQAVHEQLIGEILDELHAIVAATVDPREQLAQLIVAIFRNNVRHRSNARIFFREYDTLPDEIRAVIKARREEYEQLIVDVLEAGMRSGQFATGTPAKVVAYGIIGMCAWAIYWFDPAGSLTAAQVGDHYAKLILAGLEASATGVAGYGGRS